MLEKFLGGSPGSVLFRLVVISVVVGVVLTSVGLSPYDIVDSVRRLFDRIYNMGFEAVEWLFRYFLLGAVIVIPVWFVARLWRVVFGEDEFEQSPDRRESDGMADSPPRQRR